MLEQVLEENREVEDHPATRGHQDNRVSVDPQDQWVRKDHKDQAAHPEVRENKEK